MKALVLGHGDLGDGEILREHARAADLVIAADGGARHASRLDVHLDAIVGDLDSLGEEEVRDFAERGIAIERHDERKDETDLELALRRALLQGAEHIVIAGALGARWDQTLANLLLAADPAFAGVRVELVHGSETIRYVRGGESLDLGGNPGDTVSLVPLSAVVSGIDTRGLEWQLEDAELCLGTPRGVSNKLLASDARIAVRSGVLAVIWISGPHR